MTDGFEQARFRWGPLDGFSNFDSEALAWISDDTISKTRYLGSIINLDFTFKWD